MSTPDLRAKSLRAIRRAIVAAALAAPPANAHSFAIGVNSERLTLLRLIEITETASNDEILGRQIGVLRSLVIDLSDVLLTYGRRTRVELTYPDDAAGGARLLRDEVVAAMGSRAKMLGPDPRD